ncbi:hypothetical protein RF11_11249 [Thelohanellus kitauei]|uniref:Uncharacterized protein n=1 Tax=Thelohanellus kitauei TaxID=669202 RepID=A0A0C2MI32_THEKT|nr:hypothetical protein RF11_11249 [Thelohanellus kitauei]
MGSVNNFNIQVELKNIGDFISSFPSISMEVPESFTAQTFSFTATTEVTPVTSLRHEDKILAEDVTQFGFTAVNVLKKEEKIILNLNIETICELGTDSITVIIEAFDLMSRSLQFSSLKIKLPARETSMLFIAASMPEELSIFKESDTEFRMTEALKYIIQVTNPMILAPFQLPIFTIDLQLALDGKEIFTVAKLTPVDKKVTVIDAKITLSQESLEKEIETIIVAGSTKLSNTIIIIALCISIGVAILLPGTLAFISYKVTSQLT